MRISFISSLILLFAFVNVGIGQRNCNQPICFEGERVIEVNSNSADIELGKLNIKTNSSAIAIGDKIVFLNSNFKIGEGNDSLEVSESGNEFSVRLKESMEKPNKGNYHEINETLKYRIVSKDTSLTASDTFELAINPIILLPSKGKDNKDNQNNEQKIEEARNTGLLIGGLIGLLLSLIGFLIAFLIRKRKQKDTPTITNISGGNTTQEDILIESTTSKGKEEDRNREEQNLRATIQSHKKKVQELQRELQKRESEIDEFSQAIKDIDQNKNRNTYHWTTSLREAFQKIKVLYDQSQQVASEASADASNDDIEVLKKENKALKEDLDIVGDIIGDKAENKTDKLFLLQQTTREFKKIYNYKNSMPLDALLKQLTKNKLEEKRRTTAAKNNVILAEKVPSLLSENIQKAVATLEPSIAKIDEDSPFKSRLVMLIQGSNEARGLKRVIKDLQKIDAPNLIENKVYATIATPIFKETMSLFYRLHQYLAFPEVKVAMKEANFPVTAFEDAFSNIKTTLKDIGLSFAEVELGKTTYDPSIAADQAQFKAKDVGGDINMMDGNKFNFVLNKMPVLTIYDLDYIGWRSERFAGIPEEDKRSIVYYKTW